MADNQDLLETIDFVVYSSSLHLFKNIKASMNRCLTFSKSKALFDLQVVFKNCFKYYTRMLKKRLPAKVFEEPVGKPIPVLLTDEQELLAVYMINTCEYCLETIPKL